ncbi:hypothetical protein RR48_01192 [Papilio machaon]|uniref:EB domain-containing protein n=1 Tax=Papilio machaon TaxID=76193 RepID=A0A0N0PCR6_PAPMA|nr:hypothetical protein RR48_01192 [Papilio machaon]
MLIFYLTFAGLLLQSNVSAIWLCSEDSECASLAGSVCKEGSCLCPEGQQSVLGGTVCADSVGDGCVVNEDCQFPDGACDVTSFTCYNLNELASPSTEEQCAGLLAVVVDGVCTCPPNFFFDRNMRDCIRVTRRFNESCVTDDNCHTFGAASRCGPPQEPWGLRTCECIPEYAVWDARREMCRLFAGIGEQCEVDSDCLAGELEIQCVQNELGQGFCTCPDGLQEVDGLCLTTGLELGDSCQVTAECTGAEHAVCEAGRCVCGDGYQQDGNLCAPVIGGTCFLDTDCVIPDTICQSNNDSQTCQCRDRFVEYDDQCWPESLGHGSVCNVTAQCTSNLGEFSKCMDGQCECLNTYHYKDGRCWPMTGLFEACSRSSECYLADITNRVVCRNGLCQCGFDFPYSEQLNTCSKYL